MFIQTLNMLWVLRVEIPFLQRTTGWLCILQKYWLSRRCSYHVSVSQVPSHVGIPGNECADRLANRGNLSLGSAGRFAQSPAQSLQPPAFSFDLSRWESLSVDKQNKLLRASVEDAKALIPLLPLRPLKPWIPNCGAQGFNWTQCR